MGWMSKLRNTLLRRDPVAEEIDGELRFHLEERHASWKPQA